MTYVFRLTCLLLLLGLSALSAREPIYLVSPDGAVHVTIIYDNYQLDQDLDTDWGFACLVEYQDQALLFDAGRKAVLYKKNVALLQIKPQEIPTLFISHEHGDHTGGNNGMVAATGASVIAHKNAARRIPNMDRIRRFISGE